MKKRMLSAILIFAMGFCSFCRPVSATTADDVRQEQEKTEEQLDEVGERIDNIETQKEIVAGEITQLDSQLVEILTSISICEDEIAAKEDEIDQVKDELKEAEQREQKQYEDMKTRIRFMYEKGDQAYLQIFLEASSLPDMLNKATYVEKLYAYDRELLSEYENTRQEVISIKEELELEEADLLSSQRELKEQQDYLERLIAEKRATVANFDSQLAQAEREAASYKEKLKQQNEEIRRLEKEEKERKEELARAQKEKEKEQEKPENTVTTVTGELAKTDPADGSAPAETSKADASAQTNTSDQSDTAQKDAGNSDKSEPEKPASSAGSSLGQQIAAYGCQFIGNPYVYGGTSLTNGTDCSGFTQAVYAHFGISIPRDSTSQRFAGREVSYAEAQPGDIICYAGHVGIYIGNGQIVHASTEKTGIKISNATYRTILSVRRIVN
ncbi:MAG: C40 family peptidase [Lachnospiraceae bacterium]|nr:C40 family peptidase [Lachnospiraceae bacterium]